MKLSTREDIEAPIATVWAAITNATEFERMAKRKGIDLARAAEPTELGLGSCWTASFEFHSLQRNLETRVTRFEGPSHLHLLSRTGGIDGTVSAELIALSPKTTRLMLAVDLKPTSLSGRVMIQTLRLAKTSLTKRFKGRVHRFAKDIAKRAT